MLRGILPEISAKAAISMVAAGTALFLWFCSGLLVVAGRHHRLFAGVSAPEAWNQAPVKIFTEGLKNESTEVAIINEHYHQPTGQLMINCCNQLF